MIIDSHEHVICPPEKQLQLMDEAGIDHTILFSTTVHPEKFRDFRGMSDEVNRLYTMMKGSISSSASRVKAAEELASAVAFCPSRYHGFGPIPLGLPAEECQSWIKTYILPHHFIGMGELLPPPGHAEILEPIFQASGQCGNLPIWIHTFDPLTWEDIQVILRLAARFPQIPVILGHLGGMHWMDMLKNVRSLPNVYLDLSALFTTMALVYAVREYPDRTFFSSDAPYGRPLSCLTVLRQNIQDPAVFQKVTGGNIARVLSLS